MSRILIIAEHDGETLNPSTAKALTGALGLGISDIDVAVFAADPPAGAGQVGREVALWKGRGVHGGGMHPPRATVAGRAQSSGASLPTSSWKAAVSSRVIGPGSPLPMGR